MTNPIVKMKVIKKKKDQLWEKPNNKQREDDLNKWSTLVRKKNHAINLVGSHHTINSNDWMNLEITLPLGMSLP